MVKFGEGNDDGIGSGGGGDGIKDFRFDFNHYFEIEKYSLDSCKERLRSLFDEVVVTFLRDKCSSKCHRPVPALCGDGRPIDLFKLFWTVRRFGGYDAISRKNLWGFVSEECGLGCGAIASLKLVYINYLSELDRWLQHEFSKRVLEDDHGGLIRKLDLLSRELEIRSEGLLPNKQKQEQLIDNYDSLIKNAVNDFSRGGEDGESITSSSKDDSDTVGSAKRLIDGITNRVLNCRETTLAAAENDDEDSSVDEDNKSEKALDGEERFRAQPSTDDAITSKSDIGNMLVSRKRKEPPQSFSGMLRWLAEVAKCTNDPSVGMIPDSSKWNDEHDEFWAEALFAREALLKRRHVNKAAGEILLKDQQKRPRMLPSMYEDEVINHQTLGRPRHSRRTPLIKSDACSCCNPSASPRSRKISHREAEEARPRASSEVAVTDVEQQPPNMNDHKPYYSIPAEMKISVGPRFQAEVPQWTGISSDSDSKWLGARMWPQEEDGKPNCTVRLDPIGKGREHQCDCSYPDSVECMRFHVAEKRLKLKQELGPLFHRWRFHLMGEEVSLSWTEEEERIFKDNMSSYAALSNKSWKTAWRSLSSKSREKLVSYYFNVYLVQRRSYQNRVTPKDVDSDDDEKSCGSIGGSFGYRALYMPRPSSVPCTLNMESTELV